MLAALILMIVAIAAIQADIAVPQVFSDHMVLQAGLAAPIFGTAAPGEKITVRIKGQTQKTQAAKDGKWLVKLAPLKPGGPHELKIAGKNTITIKDVLVGEVWLASGQSNMRYPLVRAKDGKAEMDKADFPKIRYCMGTGPWVICSPRSCRNFSAVAYFFAVDLHANRKVPVGIIENAVSGAVAQVFVSKEAFDADPRLTEMVSKHKHNTGANSSVWDKSIAPVVPYGIKGALWFQGEGNRDFPVTYRKLLTALIADWRKQWGQGDFPFLVCQLTNFRQRSEKPREGKDCSLRDAQLKVVQAVPNTA
ncbi:sialate O-acetylesterase, partial [Planctomycetota bacterium]